MKTPSTRDTPGDQDLPPPQPVATPLPPPGPPAAPASGPPVVVPPVVVPPGPPTGQPQAGPPQAPPVGPPGVPQAPPPIPQPGANMTGPPTLPPPGPPPGPGASSSGPKAPPPGPGAPPGPGVPPVPFSGPPTRPPPQPMPGVPAETDVKLSEDEEESSYDDPPIKEFRPPIPADHDDIWIQRVSPGNNSKPGPLVNSYLTIEYTGWIKNSGDCFDQIDDFALQMGNGDNIVGLEKILLKMREGETILAYIPSHLAYGEEGGGDVIPPNSDLVFDLTLNSIN